MLVSEGVHPSCIPSKLETGYPFPTRDRFHQRRESWRCSGRARDVAAQSRAEGIPLAPVTIVAMDKLNRNRSTRESSNGRMRLILPIAHTLPTRGSVTIDGDWLPDAMRSQPHFKKAYAEGYGEQARFVANQLLRLVETLSSHTDSPPAMMIVGDHGSAMGLDFSDPKRTDLIERMSVFSAYRLPDLPGAALYPEISPLNGTRALARYFGADLPFLPEWNLFSLWNSPYSFVSVASQERAAIDSANGQ